MIRESGTAFPISNLYKKNLEKIEKNLNNSKSYKDICNSQLYDLKECFNKTYDKDLHEVPIDNDPTITNKFALLMDCNWEYYVECRNKNAEIEKN